MCAPYLPTRQQVHKAQLRRFTPTQLRRLQRRERGRTEQLVVAPGDTAWGICNTHGISLAELAAANRCVNACFSLCVFVCVLGGNGTDGIGQAAQLATCCVYVCTSLGEVEHNQTMRALHFSRVRVCCS